MITSTGTFQKFYEQAELAAWIEQALGIQPLAAAPGIFYVFRDPSAAQQFLANRVSTATVPAVTYRPACRSTKHTANCLRRCSTSLIGHARAAADPASCQLDQELGHQGSLSAALAAACG